MSWVYRVFWRSSIPRLLSAMKIEQIAPSDPLETERKRGIWRTILARGFLPNPVFPVLWVLAKGGQCREESHEDLQKQTCERSNKLQWPEA